MGIMRRGKVVCVVVLLMATLCFSLLAMLLAADHSKMVYGEKIGTNKLKKVLYVLKEKEMMKQPVFFAGGIKENGKKEKKKSAVKWELRAAPLGPDPLHHNGGTHRYKKPAATTMLPP